MAPEKRLGRREFLAASAAALGSSIVGCDGDDPVFDYGPPRPQPDPVSAEISGDTELQIPTFGQPAVGAYSSSASTGAISLRIWTMEKDDDPFPGRWTEELGGGINAEASFLRPGTYTVKLEVQGPRSISRTEHQTTIRPPSLPAKDYPLIAALGWDADPGVHVIYLMDPPSARAHRLVASAGINGQTLTWERTGERLALDGGFGNYVLVFNLLTDDLTTISRGESLGRPSWNPKKDWIGALEQGRALYGEPVLVRPDGSEALYVAGETPSREVAGSYLSWAPDGERLVLAGANFDVTGGLQDGWGWDRRAAIYEGFWSGGGATRVQIPTEDQIVALLDSYGDLTDLNRYFIFVGITGISWSPDGEELLYRLEYGVGAEGSRRMLAKSRVDGTGDIQVLVPHGSLDGFFSPKWSPDGKTVLFSGSPNMGENSRTYRMSSEGGYPQEITDPNLSTSTIAWYQ